MNEVNTNRIQLVCFDLGRVLIRICDNWKHACERAGIRVPTREIDRAVMMDLVIRHETGRIDDETFCRLSSPVFGLNVEQVRKLSDAYIIEPYPGVEELIAELRATGVKTACLSNTNSNHWHKMCDASHHCGLPLDQMDYRFASQLIGQRKPDDAIYRHVEEVTGIAGGHIAFFDDMPINIDAAKQRGWEAFVIKQGGDPIAQIRGYLATLGVL